MFVVDMVACVCVVLPDVLPDVLYPETFMASCIAGCVVSDARVLAALVNGRRQIVVVGPPWLGCFCWLLRYVFCAQLWFVTSPRGCWLYSTSLSGGNQVDV